ncbi:MAG: hypothetical protein ABJK11_09170 [Balneola sp.]
MKRLCLIPLFIITSILIAIPSKAQERRTMSFDAATSLMLQEFQAMLVEEDGEIKVRVRLGNSSEPGDKLEQGDLIIMMNGKRTKTITELRELYESVPKNEEVKIGVRRGNDRFILRKTKGDIPKPGEGGNRMVMSMEMSGDGPSTVIPELGLILSDNNEKVIIQRAMEPLLPEEFKELDLAGFSISSINDQKPEDAEDAKMMIDVIETGADITFTFSKSDDEIKITIKKPKANGNVSIRTDG